MKQRQASTRAATGRKRACTPSESDVLTYIQCPHTSSVPDHHHSRCRMCRELKEFSICCLDPTRDPSAMPKKAKGVVYDTLKEDLRKIGRFLEHIISRRGNEEDLQHFSVSDTTWGDVAAYYDHLDQEGKSAGHLKRVVDLLSKFMNWAKSSGYEAYGSRTSPDEDMHRKRLQQLSFQLKVRMLRDRKARHETEEVPLIEEFLKMQQSVDERSRSTLLTVLLRAAKGKCQTGEGCQDVAQDRMTACDTFHNAVKCTLEQLESGQLKPGDVDKHEAVRIQCSVMLSLLVGYTAPLRMTCIHNINLPGLPEAHWCKEYKCPPGCKGNCLVEKDRKGEHVLLLHLPHHKSNLNGNSGIIEFEPSPKVQNLLRLAMLLTQPALASNQSKAPARLFLNTKGEPFTASSASKWFQRLWKKYAPTGSVWTSAHKVRHSWVEAVARKPELESKWDGFCAVMGNSKPVIKTHYDRGRHKRLCQAGAVEGHKFYQHIKAGMNSGDCEEQSPWDEVEDEDMPASDKVAKLQAEVARLRKENQELRRQQAAPSKLQQASHRQVQAAGKQAVAHKQLRQLGEDRQQWRLAGQRSEAAAADAGVSRGRGRYPLRSRSAPARERAPAAVATLPATARAQAAGSKQLERRAVQLSKASSRAVQMKRVGAAQAAARPSPEPQPASGVAGGMMSLRVTRSSGKAAGKHGHAALPAQHCGNKRKAATDSSNSSSPRYPKRARKGESV